MWSNGLVTSEAHACREYVTYYRKEEGVKKERDVTANGSASYLFVRRHHTHYSLAASPFVPREITLVVDTFYLGRLGRLRSPLHLVCAPVYERHMGQQASSRATLAAHLTDARREGVRAGWYLQQPCRDVV